jgi:hypothetical protein
MSCSLLRTWPSLYRTSCAYHPSNSACPRVRLDAAMANNLDTVDTRRGLSYTLHARYPSCGRPQQYQPGDAELVCCVDSGTKQSTIHSRFDFLMTPSLVARFSIESCTSFLPGRPHRTEFPSLGLVNSASPVVLIDHIQQTQITGPLPSQSEGRKPLFLG